MQHLPSPSWLGLARAAVFSGAVSAVAVVVAEDVGADLFAPELPAEAVLASSDEIEELVPPYERRLTLAESPAAPAVDIDAVLAAPEPKKPRKTKKKLRLGRMDAY